MPKQVLTRRRSWTARIAVLAVVLSIFAVALPASAHSVAISTSVSCPAATPNAGFTDIGAFSAEIQLAINCLAAFDITQGTTATTFSPNGTVLRWQMALFLVRQAAVHGIAVPAAANQGYTDITGLPQATIDAINQVTQLGISKGTSSTTFSPNDPVTRWQMALFLRRLAVAAGVSVTDDPAHNQFTDIGAYTAEIQAAINFLADAHIALGTGGSLFSGNDVVSRWQMALFLTRVLAADNIAAPAGLRVTVTPTDTVTQGAGTARVYTATFKNADGTAYTGAVGVLLRIVSSAGVIDWDGAGTDACPDDTVFEAPTDNLAIVASPNTGSPTCGQILEGFPGTDGIISFTVRHDTVAPTAAERVVPVAWEDLNNDNDAEITGNNPPTEPFGVGGQVAFGAVIAGECGGVNNPQVFSAATVTAVDKTADRIEVNPATGFTTVPCSIFYDAASPGADLFRIAGAGTDLAGFEAALNVGDILGGTYDPDTSDQSTLDITTNNDPALTVTTPAAATTVDAAQFTITGTGVPGFQVRIYQDDADGDGAGTLVDPTDDNETRDLNVGGDPLADEPSRGTNTVNADGTWSVTVDLIQGIANFFIATQASSPAAADGSYVDVPTITEGAAAAAQLALSDWTDPVPDGILNPGDTIVLNFNETVTAPNAGDQLDVSDASGTQARLTCGTEATCTHTDSDTITLTVNVFPQIIAAGTDGVLTSPATINALGGYVGTDGLGVNVLGSPAANRQLIE